MIESSLNVLEVDGIESLRLSSLRRGLLNFFSVKCDICGGYDNEQVGVDHFTHAMTTCCCHSNPNVWEKEASKMDFRPGDHPVCEQCWTKGGLIHQLAECPVLQLRDYREKRDG